MTESALRGGLRCNEDCVEHPCVHSCSPQNDKSKETFKRILGFEANINYDSHIHLPFMKCWEHNFTELILYPDCGSVESPDPDCDCGSVEFLNNSRMVHVETGQELLYGQFCIDPLEGGNNGSYRVRACMKTEEHPAKWKWYYIVLTISIICLAITIAVYTVFRSTLLSSEYNKIMINFAVSLLFAFLLLVISQKVLKEKTNVVCTILALTNQFFILSAFFWMTLMSYEIFKQIHGMKIISMEQSGILKRKAPIGYGLPALISLITLAVELAAPHCSSIRPKFGLRCAHSKEIVML
jgi:hypothetical protein